MGRDALGVIFVLMSLSAGIAAILAISSKDGRIPFWEVFFFMLSVFAAACALYAFIAGGICILVTCSIDYKKHTALQLVAVMFVIGIVVALISWEAYNALRYPTVATTFELWAP